MEGVTMSELAIAIVSSGRADTLFDRVMTSSFLGTQPWYLYVPAKELRDYITAVASTAAIYTTAVRGIPAGLTYHQALDYTVSNLYMEGYDKALILDDDRTLTYWPNQTVHKAGRATPAEVQHSISEMVRFVSAGIPLVGCRLRCFCWQDNTLLTLAGKCVGMQLLHLPTIVNKYKFEWAGRSMHDHHMLAQLLRDGFLTLTYNKLLHDDRFGHMALSGCGQWRTAKMHSQAAVLMEREFPTAVKSRLKGHIRGEELYDITFKASRLLNLDKHLRIFGEEYLTQVYPFVKHQQQEQIDVALQNRTL